MLAALLNLEQVADCRFRSYVHQTNFRQTLFGGQVLAQALMAAGMTVDSRSPHSLHAYFLRAGTSTQPVAFEVDRLRDGGRVSSRAVRVLQNDQVILNMMASFHNAEPGFAHQLIKPPHAPPPTDALPPDDDPAIGWLEPELMQLRLGDQALFEEQPTEQSRAWIWARSGKPLPDIPLMHYCALAFASDIGLLASAFMQQQGHLFNGNAFAASMDHAIWFHEQPDANQWLMCTTESPWAGHARALCYGHVFDLRGRQLASCTQEGLVRSGRG